MGINWNNLGYGLSRVGKNIRDYKEAKKSKRLQEEENQILQDILEINAWKREGKVPELPGLAGLPTENLPDLDINDALAFAETDITSRISPENAEKYLPLLANTIDDVSTSFVKREDAATKYEVVMQQIKSIEDPDAQEIAKSIMIGVTEDNAYLRQGQLDSALEMVGTLKVLPYKLRHEAKINEKQYELSEGLREEKKKEAREEKELDAQRSLRYKKEYAIFADELADANRLAAAMVKKGEEYADDRNAAAKGGMTTLNSYHDKQTASFIASEKNFNDHQFNEDNREIFADLQGKTFIIPIAGKGNRQYEVTGQQLLEQLYEVAGADANPANISANELRTALTRIVVEKSGLSEKQVFIPPNWINNTLMTNLKDVVGRDALATMYAVAKDRKLIRTHADEQVQAMIVEANRYNLLSMIAENPQDYTREVWDQATIQLSSTNWRFINEQEVEDEDGLQHTITTWNPNYLRGEQGALVRFELGQTYDKGAFSPENVRLGDAGYNAILDVDEVPEKELSFKLESKSITHQGGVDSPETDKFVEQTLKQQKEAGVNQEVPPAQQLYDSGLTPEMIEDVGSGVAQQLTFLDEEIAEGAPPVISYKDASTGEPVDVSPDSLEDFVLTWNKVLESIIFDSTGEKVDINIERDRKLQPIKEQLVKWWKAYEEE